MNARMQRATIHPIRAGERPDFQDPGRSERPRRICRDKLFVQVILCGSDPELVGRTWSCRAVAASDHSLDFTCERPLPPDALVDLWVDLSERPGKFFLSGGVSSAVRDQDGQYRTRVLLEDGAATDIEAWTALHS